MSSSLAIGAEETEDRSPGTGHGHFYDLSTMVPVLQCLAKYLSWEDLVVLRLCSKKSMEIADNMWEFLIHLAIRPSRYLVKNGSFSWIFMNCRELVYISLQNVHWLTNEILSTLLKNSPELKCFSMWDYNKGCITSHGLLPLATHCKKLKNLALQYHMRINDDILHAMIEHGIQLVHVVFEGIYFSTPALEIFFLNQPLLEEIYLWEHREHFLAGGYDISSVISAISYGCPNLRKLNLKNSVIGDEESLLNITGKCKKIQLISLIGREISQEIKMKLMRNRPNISYTTLRTNKNSEPEPDQTLMIMEFMK